MHFKRKGTFQAARLAVLYPTRRHKKCGRYRAAASCGIVGLRSFTPTPRQSSLHAHLGRAEGRPVIAADTSTWVAFLEGGAGEGIGRAGLLYKPSAAKP